MRAVAGAPASPRAPRPPRPPGRWIWGLSGAVTIAVVAIPAAIRVVAFADSIPQKQYTVTRTVTVSQPVTSLNVQSDGAPVLVMTGRTRNVQVTEAIAYEDQGGTVPAVTDSVSGGRLTLGAAPCDLSGCSVGFTVLVPPAENVEVTVLSDGGPVTVDGLAGSLHADTGGGPLMAQDLTASTVAVSTEGGAARLTFTVPPQAVTVDTSGGAAVLTVPGGPYALTADTDGGPQAIEISTDSAAPRSITVVTGGGPLLVGPSALGTAGGGIPSLSPVKVVVGGVRDQRHVEIDVHLRV